MAALFGAGQVQRACPRMVHETNFVFDSQRFTKQYHDVRAAHSIGTLGEWFYMLCSSNRNVAYRQMRAAQAGFTNTAQTGLVCPELHQIPMLPRRMEGAETLTCFCTPNFIF